MKKYILIYSLLLFSTTEAMAELYPLYRGARAHGMGDADIAVVNDETALLVNPAALGKLRSVYGTLLDPEIDIGEKGYAMTLTTPPGSYLELDQLKSTLDNNRNVHYHYKHQIFPSFVLKNFGIGILGKYSTDASMNSDGTKLIANYYNDMALVLGYSFRFWDGRIKVGFNIKALNRVQASGEFDPNTSLALADIAKTGSGLSNDVGLILTAPWAGLPTISAVARDVGDTKFSQPSYTLKTATRPDNITQDMDVAIAFFPIHASQTRSSFTLEYKNIMQASTVSNPTELYHLGWELNMYDMAFFRLGMNGNYWTSGFEYSTERTQVQLSYYGQEVGLAGTTQEDRRIVLKMALRF